MKEIKPTKINTNDIFSFLAILGLAVFAFYGIQSMIKANPGVVAGIATLLVFLLAKTACKK